MDENATSEHADLFRSTVEIVVAYVSSQSVRPDDLAELIQATHGALSGTRAASPPEPLEPPVSIKDSLTPDYIVSMEDGRRYKSLKRHLTARGMTPEGYRRKWSLPVDYPMVPQSYSQRRSDIARTYGPWRHQARNRTEETGFPSAPATDES